MCLCGDCEVPYTVIDETTRSNLPPTVVRWYTSVCDFEPTSSYGLFRRYLCSCFDKIVIAIAVVFTFAYLYILNLNNLPLHVVDDIDIACVTCYQLFTLAENVADIFYRHHKMSDVCRWHKKMWL